MTLMEVLGVLVHPDEKIRNNAVDLVSTITDPKIIDWMVSELVKIFSGRNEQLRGYAQEAIIAFGRDATNRVSAQLMISQDVAMQLALVKLLTEIGVSAAPEDGPDVFCGLLTTANTSRNDAVVESCMQGITRIRWPNASQEEIEERARYARATLVLPGMAQIAAAYWTPR